MQLRKLHPLMQSKKWSDNKFSNSSKSCSSMLGWASMSPIEMIQSFSLSQLWIIKTREKREIIYPTWQVMIQMGTFQTSTRTKPWSRTQTRINMYLMAVTKWCRIFKALTTQVEQMCLRTETQRTSWTKFQAKSSSKVKLTSLLRSNLYSIVVALRMQTSLTIAI